MESGSVQVFGALARGFRGGAEASVAIVGGIVTGAGAGVAGAYTIGCRTPSPLVVIGTSSGWLVPVYCPHVTVAGTAKPIATAARRLI